MAKDDMKLEDLSIDFYSVICRTLSGDNQNNRQIECPIGHLTYSVLTICCSDSKITTFDVINIVPKQSTRKRSHLTRLLFLLANDDRFDRIRFHSQLSKNLTPGIEEWKEGGVGFIKEEDYYIWYKPDLLRTENRYENLQEAAAAVMKMKKGMHRVYSKDGVLECGKHKDTFTIDFIEIWKRYRNQGRWSALLRFLAAQSKIKKIVVFMVCNDHMDRIMKSIEINDRPFIDRGCEYVWSKGDSD